MLNIYFISWLFGIPLIYYSFIKIFRNNNLYQKITINNNKEDTIISHIITSLICITYISISGVILYFKYSDILFDDSFILKTNYDIINHIGLPMILYQGWNIIITYLHKDLYSFIFIIHHILVVLIGIIGLYNYYQNYAIIYFGLIEISNIFCIFPLATSIKTFFGNLPLSNNL